MKRTLFCLFALAAFAAQAEYMDRPAGIRIGQRMTLRPSVSFYYTFDSNVDSANDGANASSFNIAPRLALSYKAGNWGLDANVFYTYHAYCNNSQNLNNHSYGERLQFNWSNCEGGPGWNFHLNEEWRQISQNDDMTNDGGRGMGRDRWQFLLNAALERRITERWHADVNASAYCIDYDNNVDSYAPMYGWSRWTAGASAGYVASKWTDFIISGSYNGYFQDNNKYVGSESEGRSSSNLSNQSSGFTIHAGIGTHATERISYRIMGGYSQFDYAGNTSKSRGFTYSASGNWHIGDTWQMVFLASSYYHPSEDSYGASSRSDNFSWGLAHSMVRNKLNATFDVAYRHQTNECTYDSNYGSDYLTDVITARLGLNYALNRFLVAFTGVEYQKQFADGGTYVESDYDYDRWRLSVGLQLTY